MLTIPKILDTPEFYDAKLSFKWNGAIEDRIMTTGNEKIRNLIFQLNHKGIMGLATAMSEMIYWRLYRFGEEEVTDQFASQISLVESGWTGLIDRNYLAVTFDEDVFPGDSKAAEVLYDINGYAHAITKRYQVGSYFIFESVDCIACIARHIHPNQKLFDTWLFNRLEESLKLFPAQYDVQTVLDNHSAYREMRYNSLLEPIIPRDFYFDPDFDYQIADIAALSQIYLNQVDYKTNPHLNSPDKMIELGFEGTPYKYQSK